MTKQIRSGEGASNGNQRPSLRALAGSAEFDARLGVPDHLAGVYAESQLEAEGILEFASPTRGADGKWYRCTIAMSNVPVIELYQVMSTISLVARRLREDGIPQHAEILETLHEQLKRRDRTFRQNAE